MFYLNEMLGNYKQRMENLIVGTFINTTSGSYIPNGESVELTGKKFFESSGVNSLSDFKQDTSFYSYSERDARANRYQIINDIVEVYSFKLDRIAESIRYANITDELEIKAAFESRYNQLSEIASLKARSEAEMEALQLEKSIDVLVKDAIKARTKQREEEEERMLEEKKLADEENEVDDLEDMVDGDTDKGEETPEEGVDDSDDYEKMAADEYGEEEAEEDTGEEENYDDVFEDVPDGNIEEEEKEEAKKESFLLVDIINDYFPYYESVMNYKPVSENEKQEVEETQKEMNTLTEEFRDLKEEISKMNNKQDASRSEYLLKEIKEYNKKFKRFLLRALKAGTVGGFIGKNLAGVGIGIIVNEAINFLTKRVLFKPVTIANYLVWNKGLNDMTEDLENQKQDAINMGDNGKYLIDYIDKQIKKINHEKEKLKKSARKEFKIDLDEKVDPEVVIGKQKAESKAYAESMGWTAMSEAEKKESAEKQNKELEKEFKDIKDSVSKNEKTVEDVAGARRLVKDMIYYNKKFLRLATSTASVVGIGAMTGSIPSALLGGSIGAVIGTILNKTLLKKTNLKLSKMYFNAAVTVLYDIEQSLDKLDTDSPNYEKIKKKLDAEYDKVQKNLNKFVKDTNKKYKINIETYNVAGESGLRANAESVAILLDEEDGIIRAYAEHFGGIKAITGNKDLKEKLGESTRELAAFIAFKEHYSIL